MFSSLREKGDQRVLTYGVAAREEEALETLWAQPSSSLFPMPPSLPCGSVTTPHNLQSASCTGMRPHTHAPSWIATSPGTEPADLFRQLRTLWLEHHSTLLVLLGPSGSKKWLAISCTQGLCKQRRNYLQSWTFDFVEAQKASGSS